MPRQPRIHRVNGFYHVILRGNYRQAVFFTPQHREQFCELLQACTQKFLCKIHLYCLMTNHIHLVIEIGDIPLSKIMQSLSSRFAQIINKSLQRSGHLFQGRYKDKIIYDEKYLLELCFYIHMNPVKAKMVECLDDYPWSSHCVYTKKNSAPWVTTSHLNTLFERYYPASSAAYLQFMDAYHLEATKPRYCSLDENGLLITIDSVNEGHKKSTEHYILNTTLKDIINITCKEFQISPDEISSESLRRDVCKVRSLAAYIAHYRCKYFLKDIGMYLNQHPTSVSKAMHKYIQTQKAETEINRVMHALKIAGWEKQHELS